MGVHQGHLPGQVGLEDQVRPAALTPAAPPRGWLVSPAFDLLFIANLGWLAALAPGFVLADGTVPVQFWQIYFLTTPHRWLTLVLVAADPDRRQGPRLLFWSLPLLMLLLIVAVQVSFGVLLCLALVDYVWNGWHFAAQHAGVLRIYARKAGGGHPFLERHGLRAFLFYVILRTAGWSTGWLEHQPGLADLLLVADALAFALAAVLLLAEFRDPAAGRLPKRCYLVSVCTLYALLLAALVLHWRAGILALTVAAAAFHAIEYLALVTHYAWRRASVGSAGLFRTLARHWLLLLAAYLLLVGVADWLLYHTARGWWVGLNLWAALLHYAYDGMIWKLRRPETALALGARGSA